MYRTPVHRIRRLQGPGGHCQCDGAPTTGDVMPTVVEIRLAPAPARVISPPTQCPESNRICFSATASFVAGTSLVVLDVATLHAPRRKAETPFAATPMLFGLQQLVEGLPWLSLIQRQVSSPKQRGAA